MRNYHCYHSEMYSLHKAACGYVFIPLISLLINQ